jgi:hypothetical protein
LLLHAHPDATLVQSLCAYLGQLHTAQLLSWTPNPRRFRNVARMLRNVASALTVLRSRVKFDEAQQRAAHRPRAQSVADAMIPPAPELPAEDAKDDAKADAPADNDAAVGPAAADAAVVAAPAVAPVARSPLDACAEAIWIPSERMTMLSVRLGHLVTFFLAVFFFLI